MNVHQKLLMSYQAAASGGSDPYWANVTSLLHFDGTNGSTTFTDQTGRSWAQAGGSTSVISTAQSKFGGSSLLVSASGGVTRIASTSGAGFQLPGDFTVEGFGYLTTAGVFNFFCSCGSGSDGWAVDVSNANVLRFTIRGTGAQLIIFGGEVTFTTGQWYHIAVTRSSGVIRGFVNGTLLSGSVTNAASLLSNNALEASIGYSSNTWRGYIDDFRLTKGVARYTSAFTPPASPFPNS